MTLYIFNPEYHNYDYFYQQRLKYKDDDRLHKYIELSKMFDNQHITDRPCYDPVRMVFSVYVKPPYQYDVFEPFDSFDLEFFPELGNSWPYSPTVFFDCIFQECVYWGKRQKSEKLATFFRNL